MNHWEELTVQRWEGHEAGLADGTPWRRDTLGRLSEAGPCGPPGRGLLLPELYRQGLSGAKPCT